MAKHFSDDLHLLIASLGKTEKSYLKKYFRSDKKKKTKKFIRLFDDVRQGLPPEQIRSPRLKHYLYNNILISLDAYHSERSIEILLRKKLNSIELLYEKALYKQCRKIISKGKKIAYQYEKFTYVLQFIRFEISLTVASFDLHSIHERADLLQEEIYIALDKLKNISRFFILYSKIFTLILEEGMINTASQKKQYQEIMRSDILASENKAITIYSRLLFFHIHAVYANALNDPKSHYSFSLKMVDHIEEYPTLFEEEKERYVIGLNNVLLALLEMKRFNEIVIYLEKLRSLPKILEKHETENIGVRAFARSYIIELSSNSKQGEFEKNSSLIPLVKKGMARFGDKINKSNHAEICCCIAYSYFGLGNYRDANGWLNKILNNKKAEELSLYETAWMLHLVIHFEMRDFDYLEYKIKTVENLLRKKNKLMNEKEMLLRFMSNYIIDPIKNEGEMVEVFKDLEQKYLKIRRSFKSQFSFFFDVHSWIESKIHRIPLAAAIKKK